MAKLPGPVCWVGGKGKMTSKLLKLVPDTKIYVEPYGGAASLLFAREPSPVEVYNDIDNRLVGLMRVLQDPEQFEKFATRVEGTLYSQEEFREALRILHGNGQFSEEDRAWALFVAQNQGFSGWIPKYEGNWGRSFVSSRGMASSVSAWLRRLDRLAAWHDRISRVQIDSRDALVVIKYWDSDETTQYLDPPYVLETRLYQDEGGHSYKEEPGIEYHSQLVELILQSKGAIVLSCYDHEVYKPLVDAGWQRTSFDVSCSAAGRKRGSKLRGTGAAKEHAARVEVVYQNPKAVQLISDREG